MSTELKVNSYKTKVCLKWTFLCCPLEDSACWDCHATVPFRRKPVFINEQFNYFPKRCMYKSTCPDGELCKYAHGDFELLYHPLIYMTRYCKFWNQKQNKCERYGTLCCFAHSLSELRAPPTDQQISKQAAVSDHNMFMNYYKTKKCRGFPYNCKCNGFDYHSKFEQRRNPFQFFYLPEPCPACFANQQWDEPKWYQSCDVIKSFIFGITTCQLSHSMFEVMYHPQIYKTVLCKRFEETQTCKFGVNCAHAHGKTDLRPKYVSK